MATFYQNFLTIYLVWAKEIEFDEDKRGVLYRREPSTKINRRNHVNYQVVLPLSLRPLILKEFHDELTSGHLAFSRTYLKIKNHYYWPTMRKDIKEYCTTCPVCIANTRSPFRTLFHPHELATAPFQVLGMGFLGPITPVSPYGNSYIITDYFSKWVEVAALPDYLAQTTCDAFYRLIMQRHGPPKTIVSDRGSNFTSKLFCSFVESLRSNNV